VKDSSPPGTCRVLESSPIDDVEHTTADRIVAQSTDVGDYFQFVVERTERPETPFPPRGRQGVGGSKPPCSTRKSSFRNGTAALCVVASSLLTGQWTTIRTTTGGKTHSSPRALGRPGVPFSTHDPHGESS
jgi:hypothetical protein